MKKRLLAGLLSLCLMLSMVPATALALDDGTEADQDVTTNMDPTTPGGTVLPNDPDSEEKITLEEGSQGTTSDTPETPSDDDDIGLDGDDIGLNDENSILNEDKIPTIDLSTGETASKTAKGDPGTEADFVAAVGNVQFRTLASAFANAEDDSTITLLRDVELTSGIDVTNNVTLDLNGRTISGSTDNWTTVPAIDYLIAVKRGGDLTINDSRGMGAITTDDIACAVKMTVKGEDPTGNVATLTVNGGTIHGMYYGISGNGTRHNTSITVNGGTITSGDGGTAIYHPQDGSLTINGGTIQSPNTAIEIRSGDLTVKGGIISGGTGAPQVVGNGNGTTTSNTGIAIMQHTTDKPINVTITGGTISGGAAIYEGNPQGNTGNNDVQVNVADAQLEGGLYSAGFGDVTVTDSTITGDISKTGSGNMGITDSTITGNVTTGENSGSLGFLNSMITGTAPTTGVTYTNTTVDGTVLNNANGQVLLNGIPYANLENAVAAAEDGDTIYLPAGTYTISDNTCITLNKKLTIQGAGPETIIQGSSSQDYNNGLFTFSSGSEGSILENLTIKYTSSASQCATVYFTYGFGENVPDETEVTKIQNVAFKGSTDLEAEKAIAISSTYIKGGSVEITGCDIQNFAYGMYFNGIQNLKITGNTIDGTRYNAINIAGDDAKYPCGNITIEDNTLTNISVANYADPAYSSGINLGQHTSSVTMAGNDISMLYGKEPIHVVNDDMAITKVTVTYKVNSEVYSMAIVDVANGEATYLEPADPTAPSGYRFDGWDYGTNVRVENGTVTLTVGSDYDFTFTANFSKISSGGGASHPTWDGSSSSSDRYDIDKPSNVDNGSIKVSPSSRAEAGDTVTITVTPDEGYELDELVVYDADGDEVDLDDEGDGAYTFEMPKSDVEIEVSFARISDADDETPVAAFVDVADSDWYADAVQYVFANGLMAGTSDTTFSPNATTTRAMIVTILYRLEGTPAVTGTTAFTDVAAGQYYADAVAWAAQNGIVSGTSATTFSPDGVITREQMAAILYRYAQHKGYDVTAKADLSVFTDAAQVSTYATDAMAWANASGLISGTSATTLSPAGSATRAQVATILMRFCENIAK